jgi:hypothetical protein
MIFRRRRAGPENPRPYGEAGSPEYWIEAMKRAYQLGEARALPEISRLAAITGMHPPIDVFGNPWFPQWFFGLWISHIAPGCGGTHAMPY